jgi:hypothetical protein
MRDFEIDIVRAVRAELEALVPMIHAKGYSYRGPETKTWIADPAKYTSEIRVTILKDGQIDDVLEFHLYRDGQQLVSMDEAITWFRIELGKILGTQ